MVAWQCVIRSEGWDSLPGIPFEPHKPAQYHYNPLQDGQFTSQIKLRNNGNKVKNCVSGVYPILRCNGFPL